MSKMEKDMAVEFWPTKMVMNIKETDWMTKGVATGPSHGAMEMYAKLIGRMIRCTGMDTVHTQMEIILKANLNMERNQAKEKWSLSNMVLMKEIGCKTNLMVREFLDIRMVICIKAFS